MKNSLQRLMSFLLIFSILLPNIVTASSIDESNDFSIEYMNIEETGLIKDEVKDALKMKSDELVLSKLEEEEMGKLRVLVELEGTPLIVKAMEQGVKVSELKASFRTNEERKLLTSQENVKTLINSNKLEVEYLNSFTNILNGFSIEVDGGLLDEIRSLPGVKKVEPVIEYEKPQQFRTPRMGSSAGMINASKTWETGYDGEGMLIAVLDTGADPYHRDFLITEGKNVKLTENKANELIRTNDLAGKYFNKKVPYAYNYYDKSNIVVYDDGASQHGMHVSGTVLANGDESKGGIKGIAPEAQLLSMKVFSNDIDFSTTMSDIYLKAIDDAIALGADAINMSLGSVAGFYLENSIEHEALKKAENAGIINSISAGNSKNIGFGASQIYGRDMDIHDYNPDVGVVGSPSVSTAALTVASAENVKLMGTHAEAIPQIEGINEMLLMEVASKAFSSLNKESGYEYVFAGIGKTEDFEKVKDTIKGKVALVIRGNNFAETIVNAQNAGAIGCIVYNHQAGGNGLINMAGGDLAKIPFAFTTHKYGNALKENMSKTKLIFPIGPNPVDSPVAGNMSDFSSWGVLPDLRLKPEITGPGGNIYSTQNGDKYSVMSGTSMSSPHSAGGSALVKDYVNKNEEVFGNLTEEDKSILVRNLMMNSATIINQPGTEDPYSPRVQGAGMMDLSKATINKVTVVDGDNNTSKARAKVELGEVSNELKFNLDLKNYGDKDLNYKISGVLLNQVIENGVLTNDFKVFSRNTDLGSVSLGAKESSKASFTLDIAAMKENQFVDGFIELEETTGGGINLVVPFVGFKGDWNSPRIIDTLNAKGLVGVENPSIIDQRGKPSQYAYSAFVENGRYISNPNEIYYTDHNSELTPYISLLRNSESMTYSILDKDGNELRVLGKEYYTRKANSMNRGTAPVKVAKAGSWNGKINKKPAKDGRYTYRIDSKLQYKDYSQKDDFKVIVDTVGPTIHELDEKKNYAFNNYDSKLTVKVSDSIAKGLTVDEVSKLDRVLIVDEKGKNNILNLDDSRIRLKEIDSTKDLYEVEIDLSGYLENKDAKIVVAFIDKASNLSEYGLTIAANKSQGHLFIQSPGHLNVYSSDSEEIRTSGKMSIDVKGYVYGWNDNEVNTLKEITANGEKITDISVEHLRLTEKDSQGNIIVLHDGPAYKFSYSVDLGSGYHPVEIKAESLADGQGNSKYLAVARHMFIDLDLPELETEVLIVENNTAKVRLKAKDNLDYLELKRSDSVLENTGNIESHFGDSSDLSYEDNVALKEGLNEIEYTVSDRSYSVSKIVYIFNNDLVDANALIDLIEDCEEMDLENYTEESKTSLLNLLVEAKELLNKSELSQEEINNMIEKIESAIEGLEEDVEVILVDKSSLISKVAEVREIDLSEYTEESVGVLQAALTSADEIILDEEASQEDVDRVLENLLESINALEKKSVEIPEEPIEEDKPSDTGRPILPAPGGNTEPSLPEIPQKEKPLEEEKTGIEKKLELEKMMSYITGYEDGTIRPEKEISREELATIISRILNEEYRESLEIKDMDFKDVKEGRWSEEAIRTLYSMGLVEGYKDGTYRPEANITRAEFATIINRLAELDLGEKKVNLVDIKGHWGEENIKNVVSNGYVDRIEDEKYRPNEDLLRYEMILVINKLLARDSIDLDRDVELPEFKDLTGKEWYFDDIMKSVVSK